MHTLKVNAEIMRRIRGRGHTVAGPALLGVPAIETVGDIDSRTHFVQSHQACSAILSDDAFEPSDIASAVAAVGRKFDIDVGAVEAFLHQTPLLSRGDDHKARRNQFMQHHNLMRHEQAQSIQQAAEHHFEHVESAESGGLSSRLVTPFIDAVLRRILDSEVPNGGRAYDQLAELPASVLEYVHHPRALGVIAAQVRQCLTEIDRAGSEAVEARPVALPQVLLAYALMGRDPLIGGLSAFLHDLVLTSRTPAERMRWLAEMTARALFRQASPVNFIGRTATREIELEQTCMRPGDRLLLFLPHANAGQVRRSNTAGLAFGHGPHVCAGAALSLAIADAYLCAFRRHADRIHFDRFMPEPIAPGVFLRYKTIT